MDKVREILQDFDPISLSGLEKSALLNRTDTKFVFSQKDLLSILPELNAKYEVLNIQNKRISHYKTLYFDTPNLDFYHAHHNGKNGRYKVRIRSYVDSELYFLELKYKYKGRTIKNRLPIGQFEEQLSENSEQFIKKIMQSDYQKLEAKLWNDFHRITLSNKESEERLTIDINLDFHGMEKRLLLTIM